MTPVLDKNRVQSLGQIQGQGQKRGGKNGGGSSGSLRQTPYQQGVCLQPVRDRYYQDFETSFAYEETPDQLKAIDDVHLDMESDTPMDRLVCGDVGYGKTEVARSGPRSRR